MIRTIMAIFIGYVVMVIVVMSGIAAAWFSLGPRFAFQGDSVEASTGWSVLMLFSGIVAAVVGGITATLVAGKARRTRAIGGLVGLLLILGILSLIFQFMSPPVLLPDGKTIDNLTFAEAGTYARSPLWYNIAVVITGVAGVLLGSKIACRDASAVRQT